MENGKAGGGSGSGGGGGSKDRGELVVAQALIASGILDAESARAYGQLFARFTRQHSKKMNIEWSKIAPPSRVIEFAGLEACPADEALQHELLNKIAIVKLNGGLGTSMGCREPKSAIPVRNGLSFLDLTVRAVEYLNTKHGVDIPLVLMNSFRTQAATVQRLSRYRDHPVSITCFTQSCFPRVQRDTYTPLPTGPFSPDTEQYWYPPGHGDVYRALVSSGVAAALLKQGKERVFISNVDNLGACIDLNILYHLVSNEVDFAVEVTDRTRADIQGGVLIDYESKMKLLELAQVPTEHVADFKSLRQFQYFNSNSLWVSLEAIRAKVAADAIQPPCIVNERTVEGVPVLELETAAGAAIEFFDKTLAIRVPRSRFLPVKNTSDLLAVQSNLFEVRHGTLVLNPAREVSSPPVIKLGPEFTELSSYNERIPFPPSALALEHLTVSGNVHFGRDITLKGHVIVVASEGGRIDLPDGSVLEDKVVTGHLRMLEH